MASDLIPHEHRTEKSTDVWLTPKFITDELGPFDLDPCHLPDGERPWDTATIHFSEEQDGLKQEWFGKWCPKDGWVNPKHIDTYCPVCGTTVYYEPYRTFVNPPYGNQQKEWVQKLVASGNGILLMAARTEIIAFHYVWQHCDALLFLPKRISFMTRYGTPPMNASNGFPAVLAAFGAYNAKRLKESSFGGAYVENIEWKGNRMIIEN